ncbi:hypothetical protein CLM62_13555 [Streptomyces sp. SA15]|uniref:hypothetical protein n=1 Tax=Streptomyces sp. SA15 TaxID=934019 RepID=UPI000BB07820|nr:hypothetical protein [Streptomyces sp. SA15]PAZ15435.1 hypothetical protein CLM62_13555 [Streptomyces sp. SA15]
MYDVSTRKRALALVGQGRSLNSVSRETGISRAAIRSWQQRLEPLPRMAPPDPGPPADERAYAYLLGLYLGDGCISAHPRGTGYYLRIACADAWPGLMQQCREAITQVRPGIGVATLQRQGGCRITNWTTRLVGGERKRYEYPRYFFTNTSTDIIRLFTDALDRVGVEWKPLHQSRAAVTISVARKASVALMDTHVGPKH